MAIYKLRKGDRDCSSAVIDALKTAGIPTGGASYTGNIRKCFESTGQWVAKPVSFIASAGDLYLREGSHVAMCLSQSPDQLMEFSHNESWGYYNGKTGDQLNNSGANAESHIRGYYNYPWNCIMHYIGKDKDKMKVAVELMKHLVTCKEHGYTMSSPARLGSGGYCEVNVGGSSPQPAPAPAPKPIEEDTGIVFTYRVRAGGKWYSEIKNLDDYAGVRGKPITDVAIKVNKGKVWYQVHTFRGGWLGKITGYNINDSIKGYAGNGKPIDAIRVYYETPNGTVLSQATYRVSALNQAYFPWQTDTDVNSNMDGYAGQLGMVMDRFQLYPTKC